MRLRSLLLVTAVALVFGIGGYTLYPGPATAIPYATSALSAGSSPVLPRVGVQAAAERLAGFNLLSNTPPVPDIEMHDEDGSPITFARFQGKVVLFNLWATWCPPCIREMPHLDALHAQYKDRGFVVVPVASGQQGQEEPAEFLRKRGLNELTTYYDPYAQFLRTFDLETLPTTFLLDRDGNMRGGVIGILDWGSAEAKDMIEALLDEQKT